MEPVAASNTSLSGCRGRKAFNFSYFTPSPLQSPPRRLPEPTAPFPPWLSPQWALTKGRGKLPAACKRRWDYPGINSLLWRWASPGWSCLCGGGGMWGAGFRAKPGSQPCPSTRRAIAQLHTGSAPPPLGQMLAGKGKNKSLAADRAWPRDCKCAGQTRAAGLCSEGSSEGEAGAACSRSCPWGCRGD